MTLKAANLANPKKQYAKLEPGTYPCRVLQVVDLGVQIQRPYKEEPKPPCQEILITYEFLDEFMPDDDGNPDPERPRVLSEYWPLHPMGNERARSTQRYQNMDPTNEFGGDWEQLIGKPVLVTLALNPGRGKHVGKWFEKVMAVTPMRKKEEANQPPLVNTPVVFTFDEPNVDEFLRLPDWIQTKVMSSVGFEHTEFAKMVENNRPRDEDIRDGLDDKGFSEALSDEVPY